MTSKTIIIGLVAVAFVAGSILTGTMAFASGDKNGKPFEALWDAIHALETQPHETVYQKTTASAPVVGVGTYFTTYEIKCDSGDIALSGGWTVPGPAPVLPPGGGPIVGETFPTGERIVPPDAYQVDLSVDFYPVGTPVTQHPSGLPPLVMSVNCLDVTP